MSGALSEEDAIKIYFTLAAELSPDWGKKDSAKRDKAKKNDDKAKAADDPYAAKLDFMMLSAPEPGEVVALFQPEFLDRELA